jgi:uncharacterized protein (TIGR02271 family)
MATTVIGVFDAKAVGKVSRELLDAGLEERQVEVLEGNEEELISEIVKRGFDKSDARDYAKAAASGKTLIAAQTSPSRVDRAVSIMEQYEAGYGGEQKEASYGGGRKRSEQQESVPVIEEELEVNKRKVATGGVRVTSQVVEKPVKETVHLREEHVEAERRPADRVLSEDEADKAFQDRTIEMTETTEEVEVGKEARVVEEVALRKRTEEREETVRDTVRRTDVEVEEIQPSKKRR